MIYEQEQEIKSCRLNGEQIKQVFQTQPYVEVNSSEWRHLDDKDKNLLHVLSNFALEVQDLCFRNNPKEGCMRDKLKKLNKILLIQDYSCLFCCLLWIIK